MAAGYLLGRHEAVRNHFDLAMVIVIFVSLIPMLIGLVRARRESMSQRDGAGRLGAEANAKKSRNAA
jgi:hypothetical protein